MSEQRVVDQRVYVSRGFLHDVSLFGEIVREATFYEKKLAQEIERLQSDVSRQMAVATEHVNETHRLRDVLEDIRTTSTDQRAVAMAANALRGADETREFPPCSNCGGLVTTACISCGRSPDETEGEPT